MKAALLITAGCLVLAAAVAGWSARQRRVRRRAVLHPRSPLGVGSRPPQRLAMLNWLTAAPRRTLLLAAAVAGAAGFALGGPVAGTAGAVYGGLAVRGALRGRAGRNAVRDRRRRLDGLSSLSADLRAGLPVPTALSVFDPPERPAVLSAERRIGSSAKRRIGRGDRGAPAEGDRDRLGELARAAVRLAEQTGAPLADLLERIEADARAVDRGLAAAAAQAAGTRATAWLLAVLPLGGVALGYGIGADPVQVLLHTSIGAGCALGAIGLQVVGLAWTDRLGDSGRRAI